MLPEDSGGTKIIPDHPIVCPTIQFGHCSLMHVKNYGLAHGGAAYVIWIQGQKGFYVFRMCHMI